VPSNKWATNIMQDAKSVILVGFGGREFWNTLQDFLKRNPEFKSTREDLIDDYTVLKFMSAARILDQENINYFMVFPFGSGYLSLDFSKLGELGGIGSKSILGILIHPEYGPWISMRGAIVTDLQLSQYNEPLYSFNPCPICSKPCISACPANTVSENGLNHIACMNFRLSDEICNSRCASRLACPYGIEHQYSREQQGYHHKFVLRNFTRYRTKI
jgi:epoxyqueuosine reductase QueG